MAPPTLLTPLPPGAPPPPMPRPSAAALAAYRPDVPVLAPLPQYAPLPEIVRAPPPPRPVLRKFWPPCAPGRLPQRLGLPLRASGGGAGPVLRSAAAVRANAPGAAATDVRAGAAWRGPRRGPRRPKSSRTTAAFGGDEAQARGGGAGAGGGRSRAAAGEAPGVRGGEGPAHEEESRGAARRRAARKWPDDARRAGAVDS